ncbi:MAG: Gldg family protein, partial [Desulfatirhabdiaceae bacterium]
MAKTHTSANRIKFLAYLVLIVLVNIAGLTLFTRMDLTENDMFSLSDISQTVVKTLSEPLTIHVFFTKNLPAPHNGTERYLHDLLEEYAIYANRNFNYQFHDVNPDVAGSAAGAAETQRLAETYGINPVQIQAIENDEIKFQRAYMGLVIVHGDLVEKIPAITTTDGLEYKLTTAIQKLNNKISALLRVKDKIQVRLVQSSSLDQIAPYMGLKELPQLPSEIESLVKKLNGRMYDRLAFERVDPTITPDLNTEVEAHHIMNLKWPDLGNGKVAAGTGAVGMLIRHGDKTASVPLLQVIQIPIIGTQYQLADLNAVETAINDHVEAMIDINEDIGYLADHGAPGLNGPSPMGPMPGQNPDSLETFRSLAEKNYSIREVKLKEEAIPDSFNTLVIAGPNEPFSDYALFQIDQFLMKGKNLAIFYDTFNEAKVPMQGMLQQPSGQHIPVNTGLEKLLEHYGAAVQPAIVMDENCFKQQMGQQMGGGERSLYFAPMIKNENISKDFDFMKGIRGLVGFKMSPVTADAERIKANGLKSSVLFRSSEKSWEMRDHINLNPMMISPPSPDVKRTSLNLAMLITGEFPSYFAGKPVPEKPQKKPDDLSKDTDADPSDSEDAPEKNKSEDKPATPPEIDLSRITGDEKVIEKGRPGKIVLVGSSEMLKDIILDEEGRSPNAVWVLNTLDYLNNRENVAVMRSKEQRLNPLVDAGPMVKTAIKV